MKAEIELSERLRKACVERGITNPKFVAQDWSGNWYHYVAEPYMCKESWRGTFTSDDEDEILLETETELNNSWRETLMEFVTPKIEAGKRYWRRDGEISGVIAYAEPDGFYDRTRLWLYKSNGIHAAIARCHNYDLDLIAEYREEAIDRRRQLMKESRELLAEVDKFIHAEKQPTKP